MRVIEVFLVLFGIYVLFQIVRKILWGSWTNEDIILALLILNIGSTFTIGLMLARLQSDHSHLKGQFKNLANDFKATREEFNTWKNKKNR